MIETAIVLATVATSAIWLFLNWRRQRMASCCGKGCGCVIAKKRVSRQRARQHG